MNFNQDKIPQAVKDLDARYSCPIRYALRITGAVLVVAALAWSAAYSEQRPEADCNTDTECMQHCPPPSDDPECDGGPQ